MADGKAAHHENVSAENGDAPATPVGIPLSRKLCYAVGGMPYQMTITAKGFFMQIFLLDVVQMDAFYASLILFLGRAWDAVTDPLVGYLVSKSGRTRFGKLIPWIVLSMPFGVLSYSMMWFTPPEALSPGFNFFWFFTWTCLFDMFMSCCHVPYSSLNMFLGGDQRDRDSATGYRMGLEMFATLAGVLVQGQIVGPFHAQRALACSQVNLSHSFNLSSNLTSPLTHTLHNTRRAYVLAALIVGAIYFLSVLILFLGVKEQLAPLSTLGRIQIPYLTAMRLVAGHSPYVKLVSGFLFASLAFQMAQGNFALFVTHAAGLGPYFQHIILVLLTSATLSVPLWQAVLLRRGKKTTLFIGLSIYAPTLVVLASVHGSLAVFIVLAIVSGASLAVLYLLPWSMLPDVVDDFKVKNPSSRDLEPMFFSSYVFFNKFGGGLAVGISTLVLHFAGYKPGACRHNSVVILSLRVLFAPVPITLLLVGMAIFYFYPITEEQRQRTEIELQRRQRGETDLGEDLLTAL